MLISKLGEKVAGLLTGQNAAASVEEIVRLPKGERIIAQEALLKAMLGMWIMYTVLSSVSMAVSAWAKGKVLVREHKMTETGIEAEELKREMEAERRKAKKEASKVEC